MKKKILSISTMIAVLLFGGLFNIKAVFAEDTPNVSMFVSPMLQKIVLIPGETYRGSIQVSNAQHSSSSLEFEVEIGSYTLMANEETNDSYGPTDVNIRSERNVMMDWIKLDENSGTLMPNESKTISFVIEVPDNAPAGSQYASILVHESNLNNNDEELDKVNVRQKFQLASAIIANVAGENIEKASILENFIPSITMNNELEASSRVRNDGNIYTDAEYTLQVFPLFSNEEIYTNEENPETSLVLPETERYYSQKFNLPTIGLYRIKQTVKIFNETSELEKIVVFCPLWLIFIIIFAIILLIMWLTIRIKSRKGKTIDGKR